MICIKSHVTLQPSGSHMEDSRLTKLAENAQTIWTPNKCSVPNLPGTVTKIEDNGSVIWGSIQQRIFQFVQGVGYLENL